MVCLTIDVGTFLYTGVFQLVISLFALRQRLVGIEAYLHGDVIVVGTVVGDVQTTVAVHERKVAIAIEAAGVARAYGDEVAVVHVVDGSRGVAIDGCGVGKHIGGTRRHVTSCKHGIVDDDAVVVNLAPFVRIAGLVLQSMEGIGGDEFTNVVVTVEGKVCCHYTIFVCARFYF